MLSPKSKLSYFVEIYLHKDLDLGMGCTNKGRVLKIFGNKAMLGPLWVPRLV